MKIKFNGSEKQNKWVADILHGVYYNQTITQEVKK